MESAPTANNVILIHTVGGDAYDVPLRTKVTFISNREGRPLPYGKMDIVRNVSYKFSITILREWRSRDKKSFSGVQGAAFQKSPLLFQNKTNSPINPNLTQKSTSFEVLFVLENQISGSTGIIMLAPSPLITVGSLPSHLARYSIYFM